MWPGHSAHISVEAYRSLAGLSIPSRKKFAQNAHKPGWTARASETRMLDYPAGGGRPSGSLRCSLLPFGCRSLQSNRILIGASKQELSMAAFAYAACKRCLTAPLVLSAVKY